MLRFRKATAHGSGNGVKCSAKVARKCLACCLYCRNDVFDQDVHRFNNGVDRHSNAADHSLDHLEQRRPILISVKQIAKHLKDRLQCR